MSLKTGYIAKGIKVIFQLKIWQQLRLTGYFFCEIYPTEIEIWWLISVRDFTVLAVPTHKYNSCLTSGYLTKHPYFLQHFNHRRWDLVFQFVFDHKKFPSTGLILLVIEEDDKKNTYRSDKDLPTEIEWLISVSDFTVLAVPTHQF